MKASRSKKSVGDKNGEKDEINCRPTDMVQKNIVETTKSKKMK